MRATALPLAFVALAVAVAAACDDTTAPRPPGGSSKGITVVPSSAAIQAGRTVLLQATLRDEFGDPLSATFQWQSSNDAVATVAPTGEVYGRTEGNAIITASSLGKSQSSFIRVLSRPPKPEGKGDNGPELARGRQH